MRSFLACWTIFLLAVLPARGNERLTPELLWKLGRVQGGILSPDGKWVVYGVQRYDLAANKSDSDLSLVPVEGGEPRRITAEDSSESSVQWVETSKGPRLFFTAKRGEAKVAQAWSLDPATDTCVQVTDEEGGVANLKVAPGGRAILFTRGVKLESTVHDRFPDLPEADARIIDGLMYRHWDAWDDFEYSHLFVAPLEPDGTAGAARDLMEGLHFDCPVPPFGGDEQFAWSPDGKEVAFTMKVTGEPATSTDTDVYLLDPEGGGAPVCITTGMDGYDLEPSYSPDGRYLAFLSMERPGFESDRSRILLHDRSSGEMQELTEGLDQTAHEVRWSPDSAAVYFRSEWRGTDQIFRIDVRSRELTAVTQGDFDWRLRDVSPDGRTLLLARQDILRPWELGVLPAGGGDFTPLTDVNGETFAGLELPHVQPRHVRATDGKDIHCWVITPPDFTPARQWPLLVYCQGGPQGQIGQWFSYRWNFHLMAAQGYVVVAPNRRGLPGFGREWNDQISKDWSGQAMQDILAATDSMLTERFIDPRRAAAVGASFGGYTVYWLMGHHGGRFRTMIAHAGLFNLESFYGSTEELFFPNWDIGGPYWESRELQERYDLQSPHRAVQAWDTPLLIFHGQRDYRVPVTQALEAFTAAQLRGLESRLVYFPDEGHWVLEPQNGVLWHRLFFDWLERTMPPEPASTEE